MTITEPQKNTVEDVLVEAPVSDSPWDGVVRSYRPSDTWRTRVGGGLAFHDDAADEIDPVTYEVIRHRLWTINLGHGETVTRISGSPVFASLDFNMCILSEDAEIVMNAPFLQYLDSGAPIAMRYIMEHYAGHPGISEGDIFLANDPWVGAAHQMDILIACPVFVDGRLFAWVSSAGHQYDLGGIVPGGWPQNAVDVFSDPVVIPPIKLVDGGVMRPDLEAMYLRQSRVPDLVALDLRAQLSGAMFARDQLLGLCEEFGPTVVKAAMRRILDASQASFAEKLKRIPDGTWSEVRYLDERLPDDRSTYRVQVNITKTGDRLVIDNKGTDAQVEGPLGFTFTGFAGSVIGTLSSTVLYEQLFAIGGADRQIDYEPESGLLSCVEYPAAVSGGVFSILAHMGAVQTAVGRMLSSDEELRADIVAANPDYCLPILAGQDEDGNYFGQALLDSVAIGSGARSFGDGVDTSGPTWSPLMALLNVEQTEQWYPIVYLYRRDLTDSGGAGQWRGGVGMSYCVTPYRAKNIEMVTNSGGMAISTYGADGLFGGYPSPTSRTLVRRATNLYDMFKDGRLPEVIEDLDAESTSLIRGKSNGTPLLVGDVVEFTFVGGGGFGDPLLRDPVLVAKDVRNGLVSRAGAETAYGVVLSSDSETVVDEAATAALRDQLMRERHSWTPAAGADADSSPATGEPPRRVHEHVVSRDEGDARVLACRHCDHVLSPHGGNFKTGLLLHDGPVTHVPGATDPQIFLDDVISLRRYCCPGCYTLVAVEIARNDEPTLPEFVLQ